MFVFNKKTTFIHHFRSFPPTKCIKHLSCRIIVRASDSTALFADIYISRMRAFWAPGNLTWRRPSPTGHSRTPVVLLSGRRAALHPHWPANGRPRRHPSNGPASRTGNEKFLHTGQDASDSTPDRCDQGSPGKRRTGDVEKETGMARRGKRDRAQVQHLLP